MPSGRAPLPSSLVMTVVPAQVAGVQRIAVVTPKPVDAILVAARELGIDEVYAVGGAQAVAALAYGTETIPAVDAIVGPGNAYVTAAKLLVSTRVRIDLPAGPSEIVVIADGSASAERVAADLLAQAEHGPDSEALLLTDDRPLSDAVTTLVDGYDNDRGRAGGVAGRGVGALGGVRPRAPGAARARSGAAAGQGQERGLGVRGRLSRDRRLRSRRDARPADGRSRALRRRAWCRDIHEAASGGADLA